jgi:hypothetical protein
MARTPRQSGSGAQDEGLSARMDALEAGIVQLEACFERDAAEGLTIRANMKLEIDANREVKLRSNGDTILDAQMIHLNPPTGESPSLAHAGAAAMAAADRLLKAPTLVNAAKAAAVEIPRTTPQIPRVAAPRRLK